MDDRTEMFEGLSKSMKEGKKMWSVNELIEIIDKEVEHDTTKGD